MEAIVGESWCCYLLLGSEDGPLRSVAFTLGLCLGRSFGESRHESHPHADECRDTGTSGAFGDLRNSYEENMKL